LRSSPRLEGIECDLIAARQPVVPVRLELFLLSTGHDDMAYSDNRAPETERSLIRAQSSYKAADFLIVATRTQSAIALGIEPINRDCHNIDRPRADPFRRKSFQ